MKHIHIVVLRDRGIYKKLNKSVQNINYGKQLTNKEDIKANGRNTLKNFITKIWKKKF